MYAAIPSSHQPDDRDRVADVRRSRAGPAGSLAARSDDPQRARPSARRQTESGYLRVTGVEDKCLTRPGCGAESSFWDAPHTRIPGYLRATEEHGQDSHHPERPHSPSGVSATASFGSGITQAILNRPQRFLHGLELQLYHPEAADRPPDEHASLAGHLMLLRLPTPRPAGNPRRTARCWGA